MWGTQSHQAVSTYILMSENWALLWNPGSGWFWLYGVPSPFWGAPPPPLLIVFTMYMILNSIIPIPIGDLPSLRVEVYGQTLLAKNKLMRNYTNTAFFNMKDLWGSPQAVSIYISMSKNWVLSWNPCFGCFWLHVWPFPSWGALRSPPLIIIIIPPFIGS